MSRGFVEDGRGTGCVFPAPLRMDEGVLGFADAVEGGAPTLDGAASDALADGVAVAADPDSTGVSGGIADGATVEPPPCADADMDGAGLM